MARTKNQKKEMVLKLSDLTGKAKSVVFVNFDKLLVKDETALRRALRGAGSAYQVVKKTLLRKALETLKVDGQIADMPGMIAIAYGDDLIAPARETYNFQKDHKDNVSIVGGIFEGKYMTKEEMLAVATIPPMNTLQGMFANIINSPLQRFAVVLSEVAKTK